LPVESVDELLSRQAGVISRSQALSTGQQPHDVRRMLRRREWTIVHPGVYVDHSGPLTWLQRAWAGVLLAWPAALCHDSALRAHDPGGRDDGSPVHVAVDRDRAVRAPPGIVVHRLADIQAKALWNLSPPRLRVEEAALDVAAEAVSELDAVAVLAQVVQSRRTTATRLLAALERRTRLRRRRLLAAVLDDIRAGACSALEHAYLDRVERPHGLPTADRQVVPSGLGRLYRDVVYRRQGLVVELDGRLFHSQPRFRDRDLERDLDAAVARLTTVRIGWGQAVDRPCSTARKLGRLLQRLGWEGQPEECPRCRQR
jgi:hypothetical protein